MEYWTFGNADVVLQLLNAIAAVTANESEFIGLMKAAALLGFLVVVVGAVLKADPRGAATWFLALAAGWYVMFVPRVEMVIHENAGSEAGVRTVGNVPLGLGFIASAGSMVGRYLTQTAETVFSLPDRASFINGGLMAPHRVSLATLNYTMINQTLASDWMNFLRDCTYYDINVYSRRYGYGWAVSAEELANSSNPLQSLGRTNNVLFVNIYTGGPQTLVCREAYAVLSAATLAEAQASHVLRRYAVKAFPGLPESEAVDAFEEAVADAQSLLYAAPIATHQLITNRWVHNLLRVEGARNAISTGNTAQAMVEFGAIQSEQSRLNAYLQSARAAHDTVPALRNVLEAVTIGLFPLVLIVMVVTGVQGMRAFMEWALFFFSLQLWGFCYALMNYFLISKTSSNVFAIVNSNSAGDISLATMGEVAEEITADMAMAGTMVWAIPVLCYAVTKGVGMGLSSMAGRMAATSQGGAESAGSQIGSGNVRSGEGRFATSTAANAISVGGAAGSSLFYTGGMGSLANAPRVAFSGHSSSAPMSLSSSMTNSATLSAAASAVAETSSQLSTQASQTRQAAIADTVSSALKSSNMTGIDRQWQSQGAGSFSQGASATSNMLSAISHATGASQDTATKLATGAGLGLPGFSAAKVSGAIEKQYGAGASAKFQASMGSNSENSFDTASKWVQTLTNSDTARHSALGGRENAKGVDARLSRAAALETAAGNAFRESQSLQSQAQAVASGQSSLGIDLAKASPQLAQQISSVAQQADFQAAINSGNVQGAADILSKSLAARFNDSPGAINQVLDAVAMKPNQAPSLTTGPDGGAPVSKADLRGQYERGAGTTATKGTAAVDSQWAQRPKVSVGGPSVAGVKGAVEGGQSGIKGAVDSGKGAVQSGAQNLNENVAPQLPGSRGGSLYVPQSQVGTVSTALGNDAAITANAVVDNTVGSAPVKAAGQAIEQGAQTALREGMQAPGSLVRGGPSVTFPYNAEAERAQRNQDPMGHVNKLRAERGLPPLPSAADQIPK